MQLHFFDQSMARRPRGPKKGPKKQFFLYFLIYLAPSGAKYWIYWDLEGRFLLKTYWARRLCWPAARKLRNSGIQNFETLIFLILGPKGNFSSIFCYFFGLFSKYLAPSGAKYRGKGGPYKNWRGVIDKPILELLTFGSNLDFSDFVSKTTHFGHFLIGKS